MAPPQPPPSRSSVPFVRSLVAPETGVLRELAAVLMQRNRLRCYFPSAGQEILFSPSGTVRKTDVLEKQGPPNLAHDLKSFFISEGQEETILIGDVYERLVRRGHRKARRAWGALTSTTCP